MNNKGTGRGKKLIDFEKYKNGVERAWKPGKGKADVLNRCKDLNQFLDEGLYEDEIPPPSPPAPLSFSERFKQQEQARKAAVDSSSARSMRPPPSTARPPPPNRSPTMSTRQTPPPKAFQEGPSKSPAAVSSRHVLLQEAASSLGGMQRARGEELDTREAELMASERHADQVAARREAMAISRALELSMLDAGAPAAGHQDRGFTSSMSEEDELAAVLALSAAMAQKPSSSSPRASGALSVAGEREKERRARVAVEARMAERRRERATGGSTTDLSATRRMLALQHIEHGRQNEMFRQADEQRRKDMEAEEKKEALRLADENLRLQEEANRLAEAARQRGIDACRREEEVMQRTQHLRHQAAARRIQRCWRLKTMWTIAKYAMDRASRVASCASSCAKRNVHGSMLARWGVAVDASEYAQRAWAEMALNTPFLSDHLRSRACRQEAYAGSAKQSSTERMHDTAAHLIQGAWCQYRLTRRNAAACTVQRAWARHQALIAREGAARVLQRAWRRCLHAAQLQAARLHAVRLQATAASTIQSCWRGGATRVALRRAVDAAGQVQRAWRARAARGRFQRAKAAARVLQRAWRACYSRAAARRDAEQRRQLRVQETNRERERINMEKEKVETESLSGRGQFEMVTQEARVQEETSYTAAEREMERQQGHLMSDQSAIQVPAKDCWVKAALTSVNKIYKPEAGLSNCGQNMSRPPSAKLSAGVDMTLAPLSAPKLHYQRSKTMALPPVHTDTKIHATTNRTGPQMHAPNELNPLKVGMGSPNVRVVMDQLHRTPILHDVPTLSLVRTTSAERARAAAKDRAHQVVDQEKVLSEELVGRVKTIGLGPVESRQGRARRTYTPQVQLMPRNNVRAAEIRGCEPIVPRRQTSGRWN